MLWGLRCSVVVAVLLWGMCTPSVARGQDDDATPSGAASSDEGKREAQKLYRAGNEQFVNRRYTEALATYEAAVELWDHPAIRYNMAECYISLVKPLEAYRQLELALADGKRPFKANPALYDRGLQLRERLLAQLGHLELVATQPNLQVTLDGKTIELEGGSAQTVLVPGSHQLTVKSPGFLTDSQSVVLSPNERRKVELSLSPVPTPRVEKRRWKRWFPWTVAGAGVALAATGIPFMALADSNYRDYEGAVAQMCPPTRACDSTALPAEVQDMRRRGDRGRLGAQVLWGIGGAAVATGAILVLLNQPRLVEVERPSSTTINASVGPDGGYVTFGWTY